MFVAIYYHTSNPAFWGCPGAIQANQANQAIFSYFMSYLKVDWPLCAALDVRTDWSQKNNMRSFWIRVDTDIQKDRWMDTTSRIIFWLC